MFWLGFLFGFAASIAFLFVLIIVLMAWTLPRNTLYIGGKNAA